jgi:GTP-binding protein
VLIHLVDIGGVDPAQALRTVADELDAYGAGLAEKPTLVALNKVDLADPELVAGYSGELAAAGAEAVFPISAATGEGVPALLDAVLARLPERSTVERQRGEEWSPL